MTLNGCYVKSVILVTLVLILTACTSSPQPVMEPGSALVAATDLPEPSPKPTMVPTQETINTPFPLPTAAQITLAPEETLLDAQQGKELAESVCIVCHSFDRVASKTKSVLEWQNTVTRMVGLGAVLSETEQQLVIQFLADTYK